MKKELTKSKKITLVVIAIVVCILLYIISVIIFNANKSRTATSNGAPLYTLEEYPKVDASLATQPLTNAFIKNFCRIR